MSTHNTRRHSCSDILVVDDDTANLRYLIQILTKAGYCVRPASRGRLALRSARARVPDLILLDIKMPDMDGIEVCRQLKADLLTGAVPVVFISGREDTDMKVAAFDAGGLDYVTKPVEPREVLARVGTHLAMHELQRNLLSESEALVAEMRERKRLEQEVIHLERMHASRELASGVSHNLNNMLTAILGPAQFLLRKSDDPVVHRWAQEIVDASTRARDLVTRMQLSVCADTDQVIESIVLNQHVVQALDMARGRWQDEAQTRGVKIDVITDLGQPPKVRCSAAMLDDAIANLLLNAVAAMPEGGTITLVTEAVAGGGQLTVRDTGTGMDEETRRRVFEPLFTTKADVGHGLGLSMFHRLLRNLGGSIAVTSIEGEGTTFVIFLPVVPDGQNTADTLPGVGDTQAQQGRLLVIDDDDDVRGFLDALLSQNHKVTVATGGEQGLEGFEAGQFDVALIDLGMPGLSGDQVAAQMKATDPKLVTILVTGWALPVADPRNSPFDFHLRKPFDNLDEVEAVVARSLALHLSLVAKAASLDSSGSIPV